MRLIKPSFEILESQGLFKDIEIAARTCYKSGDKITEDSAEKMVKSLIERKHTAMLEHGTIYLKIFTKIKSDSFIRYYDNKYSKCIIKQDNYAYITTNYRVMIENGWYEEDLQYQCLPTKYHERRITVRFICDRGVSHEFVRHRAFSFAQESTRYCNYSKDKFDNQLTFICPPWIDKESLDLINEDKSNFAKLTDFNYVWANSIWEAENAYMFLLDNNENVKWSPQQARMVLPNSLKTELVMTGSTSDWKGFFKLRDTITAHPQAFELAHPLHEQFKKLNLL